MGAIPFNWMNLLRAKDYRVGYPANYKQEKKDGLRLLITHHDQGEFTAETREGKTDFWPVLSDLSLPWVDAVKATPPGTALDGEIHAKGIQATDIKTLIAARDLRLLFSPFAMPFYGGDDKRGERLDFITTLLQAEGFEPPVLEVLTEGPITSEDIDRLKFMASEAGLEGYVLKEAHYAGWYKVKPVRTIDVVVIGTTISNSDSFCGGLKAVQVAVKKGTKLVEVASVSSGFMIEYRKTVNLKSLIGKVAEVSYDSVAGKGKLKFPRFIRWRDDKVAAECTWDQLDVETEEEEPLMADYNEADVKATLALNSTPETPDPTETERRVALQNGAVVSESAAYRREYLGEFIDTDNDGHVDRQGHIAEEEGVDPKDIQAAKDRGMIDPTLWAKAGIEYINNGLKRSAEIQKKLAEACDIIGRPPTEQELKDMGIKE